MKKRMIGLLAVFLAPMMVAYASPAHADAGVSINLPGFGLSVGPGGVGLNIGLPWVVAPAPVPPPVYAYPDNSYQPVAVVDEPEFVMPPELGFYVAVGVPYDLYFYNNSYWINRSNIWYSSAYYNGPWTRIYYRDVPYLFNRYPFERVRHYRDAYYGRYQKHGVWDGYTHFRPAHRDRYRGEPGHDRRGYARYENPNYRNRPDMRQSNTVWQGNGRYYGTKQPPTYNRDYRNSRADSRTYRNRPANYAPAADSRFAYTRPDRNGKSYGNEYANYRRYSNGRESVRTSYGDSQNRRADFTRGWHGERR